MKTLITAIICILSISCFSQLPFDIGTKWTYTFPDFGILEPACIEVTGDTIINGTKWYSHEGVGGCASNYKDALIRVDGQQVYMYDVEISIEFLLYDYDKIAGESWIVYIFGTDFHYEINVLSVDTIEVDGVEYKIQNIDNANFGKLYY